MSTGRRTSASATRFVAFDNSVHGRLYRGRGPLRRGRRPGVGLRRPAGHPQVGGVNAAAGSSARLVQVTPWQHYQESFYDSVYSVIRQHDRHCGAKPHRHGRSRARSTTASACSGTSPTSARTRQSRSSPPPGASATSPPSTSTPPPAQVTGKTATVTVTARNADGGPDPGRTVRYAIAGANPGAGAVTTGADGTRGDHLDRHRTSAPTRSRAFTDSTATASATPTSPSGPRP